MAEAAKTSKAKAVTQPAERGSKRGLRSRNWIWLGERRGIGGLLPHELSASRAAGAHFVRMRMKHEAATHGPGIVPLDKCVSGEKEKEYHAFVILHGEELVFY